ncbi:sigma-70 family RNA polymerase sigma factor [Salinibacterium sp. ZJ70]|uniref:sigma-70 family RNA polymerase sigma factor n=1 Tax=Salinibacterium sp. ZJ70 TaxID=2708084 RepID=UPI0014232471|nr:sigma-70 family RNA polymerase sigma factor [Salinibacterium sp. ZJ70]
MTRVENDVEWGDHELITRSKAGDRDAFGELWRRHSDAARRVAALYAPHVADDITVDAFAAIFQQFQKQGGPDHAFRAYLYTVVRNLAAKEQRSASRLTDQPLDEQMASPMTVEEETLAQLENGATASAFRALPERWQSVLWYVDVEGLKPAQAAPLLGIEPNAVSALALRAREALKQNWIQAQLAGGAAGPDCAVVDDNLGKFTRRKVSARTQAKIDAHASGCMRCRAVIAEGADLDRHLAAILFPIVTGVSAAALLRDAVAPATAAAAPVPAAIFGEPSRVVDAAVLAGPPAGPETLGAGPGARNPGSQRSSLTGSSAGSGSGFGATALVGLAAAVVVVGSGAGVAVVSHLASPPAAEQEQPTTPDDGDQAPPTPVDQETDAGAPVGEVEELPAAPGADSRDRTDSRAPVTVPPAVVAPTPAPVSPRPDAPVFGAVASIAAGSLPTSMTGTGEPGATISVRRGSEIIAQVVVADDGTWTVPFTNVEFAAGSTALQITQSTERDSVVYESAPTAVTVEAAVPTLALGSWYLDGVDLRAPITVDLASDVEVLIYLQSGGGEVTAAGQMQVGGLNAATYRFEGGAPVGTVARLGVAVFDPVTGARGPIGWTESVVPDPGI